MNNFKEQKKGVAKIKVAYRLVRNYWFKFE